MILMAGLIGFLKGLMFFTGSYSHNAFPEPLSPEEEKKYIDLWYEGDEHAKNKLIEHNLRLVAHIVKKFEKRPEDTDDLISIGTIGLIKGVNTFKFKHGTKLTTYCARCIENEILMHFRSNKKNSKNVSLDESIGFDKEGNEISLINILKLPKPDFAEELHIKDNIALLNKYLHILSPREKDIIIKRYGLNEEPEITQKKIAENLKISRSYVSRIEKRALTKILREFIKNKDHPLD